MRDQRLREVKELAQGHTVNKWYKGNFSPSLPDVKGPAWYIFLHKIFIV